MYSDDNGMPPSRRKSPDLLQAIPPHLGPRLLARKGGVAHSIRHPGEMTFHSHGDFIAILFKPVPGIQSRLGSDRFETYDAPAGMLVLNPANVDSGSRWSSVRDSLAVGFEPGQLALLAGEEFGIVDLTLQPPAFGHVDQRALQIAHLVKNELAEGTASEVYIDSLMTILGIHIVRHYSGEAKVRSGAQASGGLSYKNARLVQEYLRERFTSRVSIGELATICEMSPGRFIRAFARTFGVSPHRYLVKLRLSRASELLAGTELSIAEVAHASGFSSQSHLTSTMRKHLGRTPAQIRFHR
ncbi:AraC family transcriptional regulator [Pelagibacterium sp. H642]|uniref:AraC family transcriptional regulator n=1 Tax=Pelagibacterium sp. H642 TaxID=1881069 RepID=UPI002815E01D|nr:AraC family transcriptional regulator [Pelagibacterium sp. H642]WMT92880.1 AraC family transcriptional regulator [Pelagibacterium sp. H642]